MDIIFNERAIELFFRVRTGLNERYEDFTRSDVVAMLEGPGDRFGFYLVGNKTIDGGLTLVVPAGTIGQDDIGIYNLRVMWFKKRGGSGHTGPVAANEFRGVMQSFTISRIFCITAEEDKDNTGYIPSSPTKYEKAFNTIKAEPYGIDGMSAYEIAILHGCEVHSEKEWIWHYEKAEQRVDEAVSRAEALEAELEQFLQTSESRVNQLIGRVGSELLLIQAKMNEMEELMEQMVEHDEQVQQEIDELQGMIEALQRGFSWSVYPNPVYGVGPQDITIHAECLQGYLFDSIAFYVDGDSVASGGHTAALTGTASISETATVRCDARIAGRSYSLTKVVVFGSAIYIGAGSSIDDVLDSSHIPQLDDDLRGTCEVTVTSEANKGHIIIVLAESERSRFTRADMNGIEILFNETTVQRGGVYYKQLKSREEFAADTYEININS